MMLLTVLLCIACGEQRDTKGKTPLVEVNGNFLYREDLLSAIPSNLTRKDSLLFSEHYIRSWVEDALLFEKARNNIPDNKAVEEMVDNYRKALIMHTYQQELINQKFSSEMSEKEVSDYYLKNKELFKLEFPLIKGLFIKVPLTAPQIANVRRWYKTESHDAVEHLEKYSLRSAVKYEYFYDKWKLVSEFSELLPLKVSDADAYFERNRNIEVKDSAFYYFLHITGYLAKGEEEPYESAYSKAKSLLLNQKQGEYIKQLKEDLYRNAIKRNEIKYN